MTKKAIKLKELKRISNENNLYFVGYCKLQNLLKFVEPEFYYSNAYGWRFDVYFVNGIIITTGYAEPRIKGLKKFNDNDVEKFENEAIKIQNTSLNWKMMKKETTKVLEQFCRINGGF